MTEIFRFFVVIILLTISLSAYLLVIDALFPNRVTKTQRVINQMSGRALGIGLVNLLFFGVILIVLLTITDANANRVNSVVRVILLIPTLILAGLLTAVLSFGFAGMVRVLGERILSDLTTLKQSIGGTVILAVACALPFVGWGSDFCWPNQPLDRDPILSCRWRRARWVPRFARPARAGPRPDRRPRERARCESSRAAQPLD